MTTLKEIAEQIEEEAGVSSADLPNVRAFSWFSVSWLPGSSGKPGVPSTWKKNSPCPVNAPMSIFAIFQGDMDVRVYTVPTGPDNDQPPTRYTLSKTAPTFVEELMDLEVFKREIVEELCELAGIDPPEEELVDDPEPPSVTPAEPVQAQ